MQLSGTGAHICMRGRVLCNWPLLDPLAFSTVSVRLTHFLLPNCHLAPYTLPSQGFKVSFTVRAAQDVSSELPKSKLCPVRTRTAKSPPNSHPNSRHLVTLIPDRFPRALSNIKNTNLLLCQGREKRTRLFRSALVGINRYAGDAQAHGRLLLGCGQPTWRSEVGPQTPGIPDGHA